VFSWKRLEFDESAYRQGVAFVVQLSQARPTSTSASFCIAKLITHHQPHSFLYVQSNSTTKIIDFACGLPAIADAAVADEQNVALKKKQVTRSATDTASALTFMAREFAIAILSFYKSKEPCS
jgi:hypothetical protein